MVTKLRKMVKYKTLNISDILKSGTLLFFPLRDTFAISIGGLPLRFGEIWAGVYLLALVFGNRKIKKAESKMLYLLLVNILVCFTGFALNFGLYDTGFSLKYVLRNILNIILISGFMASYIYFTEKDIDWLMKYSFRIQLLSFIVLYATGHCFVLGKILNWAAILQTGQVVDIGVLTLPRFLGTSSEPGYLTAFLPMLLYYFFVKSDKRKNLYIFFTIVMIVFTFSSAVYVASIGVITYLLIVNKKVAQKYLIRVLGLFAVLIGIYVFIPGMQQMVDEHILVKIIQFLTNKSVNYSARERSLQINYAWNLFKNFPLYRMIIGNGTGGYLYNTLHYGSNLLSYDVEEAYNLYLSTLVDRGMLGFLVLVAIFICILSFRNKKDIYSNTLGIGIIIQFFHWMITGNLWQYYFWAEVILLIGYHRYHSTILVNVPLNTYKCITKGKKMGRENHE